MISHDENVEEEQEDVKLVIIRMIGYGGAGSVCLLFTALTNPTLKSKQTSCNICSSLFTCWDLHDWRLAWRLRSFRATLHSQLG
jgi:hypothetical protein